MINSLSSAVLSRLVRDVGVSDFMRPVNTLSALLSFMLVSIDNVSLHSVLTSSSFDSLRERRRVAICSKRALATSPESVETALQSYLLQSGSFKASEYVLEKVKMTPFASETLKRTSAAVHP